MSNDERELPCPLLKAIELAGETLDMCADLVTDGSVRGHLELCREIAERIHAAYRSCETVRDQDGQLTCSLAGIFSRMYDRLLPVAMIAAGKRGADVPGAFL